MSNDGIRNNGRRRTLSRAALLGVAALVAAACAGQSSQSSDSSSASTTELSLGTLPSYDPTTVESTTVASTTEASTTTMVPPVRHVTTMFSGDVLVHTSVWNRAGVYAGGNGYDFAPMFAEIQPLVSSVDLGICHLETPLASPGEKPQTYPRFAAPPEIVAGIASAGYDRCSTASNHSMDQGVAGVLATIDAFDAQGLTQAGMARDAASAEPRLLDINGVKVAHLSYTRGFQVLDLPPGESWWANDIDVGRILNDAQKARDMGAEIVIVSMHWGTEPNSQVSETQRWQAEALTASGLIDLIVGHHTHVVQPIEQINGVWTVFGMGNSLSNMPVGPYPPSSQDGVLVEVGFDVAPDGKVTVAKPVVYPTRVDKGYTFIIRDVLTDLARTDLTASERSDYERTLRRVSSIVGEFVATAPFGG